MPRGRTGNVVAILVQLSSQFRSPVPGAHRLLRGRTANSRSPVPGAHRLPRGRTGNVVAILVQLVPSPVPARCARASLVSLAALVLHLIPSVTSRSLARTRLHRRVPFYTIAVHSARSLVPRPHRRPYIPLVRPCPVHTVALNSVRSLVQFRSLVSPVVPPVALFGAADAPSRRVPRPSSAGTLYGFAVIARIWQLRHGGAAHRSFRSCGLERASPDPDRLGFRSCGDLGK